MHSQSIGQSRGSIDKLDNLAMNVQFDKEKHMENAMLRRRNRRNRRGQE